MLLVDKVKNPQAVDINKCHIIDGNLKKSANRGIISRVIARNNTTQIGDKAPSGEGKFIIEGKGYGHGVGMSQWGVPKGWQNQGIPLKKY